ncbi:PE-PPE domain-containing protein [Mycolicibacterium austroafricanum]|uniref:PE-PPE domain-containing protein n=1 Tax=Mycolicibacterium austroafricanum TaxID=39687 RepID=UPI001F3EC1B8|nr:PE-PPE domain-containing protein [Mycolicibacterium austroafricanum]
MSVVTSTSATAGTALIMGGNGHPLSVPQDTPAYITKYVTAADDAFIAPSGLCGAECSLVATYTPAQIRFVNGIFDMTYDESVAVGQANLNDCIQGSDCTVTLAPYTETGPHTVVDSTYVIYAYSQSATVAGNQKLYMIAHPVASTVSFLLVANPNRPNGGILERFVGAYLPLLGITFNGSTPTFSPQPRPLTTVDIARQYDGWADFPTNPLNLLADLNAIMGTVLLHPNYSDAGTPQLQGQYQDSTYYLIEAPITPVLMPLTWVPIVGKPLAIALDPAVRVLVEMGYDRTVNPGQPTPARYLYVPNLIKAALDLAMAIPTGWDDAISYLAGDPDCRPFHTTVPASPFGVGGPAVYTGAIDPYGVPTPYLAPPDEAHSEAAPGAGALAAQPGGTGPPETVTDSPTTESTPPTLLPGTPGESRDMPPDLVENDTPDSDEAPPPTDDAPKDTETIDESQDDPTEIASGVSGEDTGDSDSRSADAADSSPADAAATDTAA